MEFNYPQKLRLGLGVSQQVGLAAKELGHRALILTEASYAGTKELSIITSSLERAAVNFIVLEKIEGQAAPNLLTEAVTLGRAGHVDLVIALGSSTVLSLGRAISMEIPKALSVAAPPQAPNPDGTLPKPPKNPAGLPYLEVPTTHCYPLLLREEGFIGSSHPGEIRFFSVPLGSKHRIYLDPHMTTGLTPATSVASHLESLFFGIEALFHESAGVLEEGLILNAVGHLWANLKNIYDNPANVHFRDEAYQAGLSVALACSTVPRCAGLSACFVIAGVASLPPSAIGCVFLAPYLELYGAKAAVRLKKLAAAMGIVDEESDEATLAQRLAQEIRKFLNQYSLPMRLRDFKLVDAEITLAADIVKGLGVRRGGLLDTDNLPAFLKEVF